MSTQSKSVLVPFLIIAAVIFIIALVWKMVGNNETPKPAAVETTVKTEVTASKPKSTPKPVIEVVDYDQPEQALMPEMMTEEEKEDRREQAKANMSYAMRFNTIEKAIEGLKNFRANGNDELAERLIVFINAQYPNEAIPAELLD